MRTFWLTFELAKQADLIQWDSLPSGARTPDHESVAKARKFAELIVRECLAQVDKVDAMLDDDKEKTGVAWVGLAIARRFGVEE